MAIRWGSSRPCAELLPRHHPAAGLLGGDEALLAAGSFAFGLAPELVPEPRRIDSHVVAALEEKQRELEAPPAVFASLRLLADGAAAVVTGQQAGLLGGPLFTLFKTLSAIRAARELSARHGRPFVPVFWAETEDHDLDEVNQAWTLGAAGPVRCAVPVPEAERGGPVGEIALGEGARRCVEELFAAAPATEYSPALISSLLADLAREPRWGAWFARHLVRLFGPFGLVVADPSDSRLAACARPLWASVLEDPLALTAICQERGRWLAELGYKPILQKTERRAPFFLLEGGKRAAVSWERGLFHASGADYTPLALLRRLELKPAEFSAAVHLRPQLQDFLLPTAVYVAGPTELGYFLQLLPGYAALGVPAPTVLLRASLTLVEPGVARTLERLGVDPAELREGTERVLTALVRREQRLAAPAFWERAREAALRPVAKVAESLAGELPELGRQADQVRGKIEFLLKDLETRAIAALRKKSEAAREQLERARERLYPNDGLQERTLSAYYFLNKYGPGLVGELLEALPADTSRHHFGTLEPARAEGAP